MSGNPGGPVVLQVGKRGAVPPPPPAEVPPHATPEARAERMKRVTEQAAQVQEEEQQAAAAQDPFSVLDGPKVSPRAVLRETALPTAQEPVEDLDSVEIELPNGRTVLYGPTRGKSHALALGRIFVGTAATAMLAQNTVEYLFNIREIDGKAVNWPTNLAEAQAILDLIDDDGWQHLTFAHSKFWPNVNDDRLKVLKKNLRLG